MEQKLFVTEEKNKKIEERHKKINENPYKIKIIGNKAVPAEEIEYELKPVIRKANHNDLKKEEENN